MDITTTDHPVRGAAPLADGFEVGFDERFEDRWFHAALVGRIVMLLFLCVCLGGLLGRGPFSHASAQSADGTLRVDYEPVTRDGTPTLVTLHLGNPGPATSTVSVLLSANFAEPMGFQRSVPRPDSSTLGSEGMRLDYTVAPGQRDALVRLALQPTGFGPVRLFAQLGEGSKVVWSQFVAP